MAVTKPRSQKPIADMNNRGLDQLIRRERKKLAELKAVQLTGQQLRAGKATRASRR